MKLYPLFLFMATLTVLSPGPGVIMTLTNSLRYGTKGTFGGILGISFGALVVAAISATSLGIVLAASALALRSLSSLAPPILCTSALNSGGLPPSESMDDPLPVRQVSKNAFLKVYLSS